MAQKTKQLHCTNCNQETAHRTLNPSEVEKQREDKNSLKYKVLDFVFGVFLNSNSSSSQISYYKCTVCGANHSNQENTPHGW